MMTFTVKRYPIRSLLLVAALIGGMAACSTNTAQLSSLKTGKDKEISQSASTFKGGDTIYAAASVTNDPGTVTLKMYITVDDAPGMTKGSTIPKSDVSVSVDGDRTVNYNYATVVTTKGGRFNMVAEILDASGKTLDSLSTPVTVEPGPAATSN